MKEFMYVIRGGHDVQKSPEEMQAHMANWQKWMSGMAEEGKLVSGQPLGNEGKTLIDSGATVIDRPLVEGKELVGGYLIVKSESLESATEMAKGCPGFEYDCTVEIREILPM